MANSMDNVERDVLLAQYRECYEYLRQHSRFMWQVPSTASAISGGLIIAAFAVIPRDLWMVRELIWLIAGALLWSLFLAMKKHRYFADVEAETLAKLEDALQTKHMQRPTKVSDDSSHWFTHTPESSVSRITGQTHRYSRFKKFCRRQSADHWLGISMLIVLGVVVALLFSPLYCLLVN